MFYIHLADETNPANIDQIRNRLLNYTPDYQYHIHLGQLPEDYPSHQIEIGTTQITFYSDVNDESTPARLQHHAMDCLLFLTVPDLQSQAGNFGFFEVNSENRKETRKERYIRQRNSYLLKCGVEFVLGSIVGVLSMTLAFIEPISASILACSACLLLAAAFYHGHQALKNDQQAEFAYSLF